MNISDEAVEAAARSLYEGSIDHVGQVWEQVDGAYRNAAYIFPMRVALTAAAPHLMAEAYDEGFEDGKDRYNINPYRRAYPAE